MSQSTSGPNLKQAVPFFMVTDMARSLDFYLKGLGFYKTREWTPDGRIEWCWIERDRVGLMLQEYRRGQVPEEKLGVGFSVCFMCDDALQLYHEFLKNGVAADEPFVGNMLWVTSVKDPDSYQLHFESPTDVPEETRYSEWKAETN